MDWILNVLHDLQEIIQLSAATSSRASTSSEMRPPRRSVQSQMDAKFASPERLPGPERKPIHETGASEMHPPRRSAQSQSDAEFESPERLPGPEREQIHDSRSSEMCPPRSSDQSENEVECALPERLPRPGKITNYVYEIYKPRPGHQTSVEIVFFDGLQQRGSNGEFMDTWISWDGKSWLGWIAKDFPDARMLRVTYYNSLAWPRTRTDLVTNENLMLSLIGEVGQDKCPVVLVGHSVGGLVIKQLCVHVDSILRLGPSRSPIQNLSIMMMMNFLNSVKGLFFYASPHHGTKVDDTSTSFSKGVLFQDVAPLSKEAGEKNVEFHKVLRQYGWKTCGIAESQPVTLGEFTGLVVAEASSRLDVDSYYTISADHFEVCQPVSRRHPPFKLLSEFIADVLKEASYNGEKGMRVFPGDAESEEDVYFDDYSDLEEDGEFEDYPKFEDDAEETALSNDPLSKNSCMNDRNLREPDALVDCEFMKSRKSTYVVEMPQGHLTHGKPPQAMEDFITEVNNSTGEVGYFVSKTWLFTLCDHEREEIMSVLWKAGCLEIYETSTTMFYERADVQLLSNSPMHTSAAYASIGSVNVTRKTKRKRLFRKPLARIILVTPEHFRATVWELTGHKVPPAQVVLLQRERPQANAVSNGVDLDSCSPPPRPNETCPMESSSGLLDDKRETSRTRYDEMFMSMRTAVKDRSRYSYSISTHWLSTLNDHQMEDLTSVLFKAGYSQLYKTNTTTYFERIKGYARDSPTNEKESGSSEKRDVVGPTERSGKLQQSGVFLPNGMQDFNIDNKGSLGLTNATKPSKKMEVKCVCPPKILTVSCRSVSSSPVGPSTLSSQTRRSKRTTREPVGDSFVTMPRNLKGRIISTSIDKDITMKTINFTETVGYSEVIVGLNVSAETSLSCCLRSDHNNERVRIELLKIGGAIKMEESIDKKTNALVLKAMRTNLDAYINSSEEGDGLEEISLDIEQDSSLPQGRRVLEVFRPCDDNGRRNGPEDLVWLELSGIHPKNSEPGSRTVELQCHVKNRLKVDSDESSHATLVLHFEGSPPLKLEGDIDGSSHPDSFLELNLRYQAEISFSEPCNPLPPPDTPYVRSRRTNKVVDFDCLLEMRTRKFSHDSSIRSHDI